MICPSQSTLLFTPPACFVLREVLCACVAMCATGARGSESRHFLPCTHCPCHSLPPVQVLHLALSSFIHTHVPCLPFIPLLVV